MTVGYTYRPYRYVALRLYDACVGIHTYDKFFFVESSLAPVVDRFLPVFGASSRVWDSQVCPLAIGGIITCHEMRHSLYLTSHIHVFEIASTFSSFSYASVHCGDRRVDPCDVSLTAPVSRTCVTAHDGSAVRASR